MTLEDKVRAYKNLALQIEQLEEQKKSLGAEILQLLSPEVSSQTVAEYKVRRMVKFLIKTPLEEAKQLGAVKIEETVDKAKIKKLVLEGHFIAGVSTFEYVQISSTKSSEI